MKKKAVKVKPKKELRFVRDVKFRDCIGNCGQQVRAPQSECRKCRRKRLLAGGRRIQKIRQAAKVQARKERDAKAK